MHGEEDETVALENALRIKSWKKNTQFAEIDHCNHTFNGKHPWNENALPRATIDALACTILFLKA